MADDLVLKTITASHLATNLGQDECTVLTSIAELKTLRDGAHLCEEGDEDDCLYIVVSGTIEVRKQLRDSSREILCRLKPSQLAGFSGFVDGQERLADMVAAGDATVLAISRDRFKSLIASHPAVVYKVMCSLVKESLAIVKSLDEHIIDLDAFLKTAQSRC